MQYTVLAIQYADGSVQYIAIDGNGQPLDPQPDLSNAIPCPVETTPTGTGECCPDYSTATLQLLGNTQLNNANATLTAIQTAIGNLNTVSINILQALTNVVAQQQYRVQHGIVGAGGTLPNPFTLPTDTISVEVVPLAVHPDTLALFNNAQLLGNTVSDDSGITVKLAALSNWKAGRRQTSGGAFMPIGGVIQVAAATGGSIFVIYETI